MERPFPNPRSQLPRPAATSEQTKPYQPLSAVRIQDAQLVEEIGRGSYAEIWKAGIPCAAKVLHKVLSHSDIPKNRERFVQECRILHDCVHRNIVRFYGVSSHPRTGQTILLMELMNETLTHFLEISYADRVLPYCIQLNLSHDIANGVRYLHSKKIIHRDLSSNNVLLTAEPLHFTAKISDFGVSSLKDAKARTQTECPGTAVYMPPEALPHTESQRGTPYTAKLDSFQLGVLMLQIATKLFPAPKAALERRDDLVYHRVPEIVRQKAHLDILRETEHSLLDHPILECLEDKKEKRPTANCIYDQICALLQDNKYLKNCDRERVEPRVRDDTGLQMIDKEEEEKVLQLTKRVSHLEEVNKSLKVQLDAKEEERVAEVGENERLQWLAGKEEENASLRALLDTKDREIMRSGEEMRRLQRQLEHCTRTLNEQRDRADDLQRQLVTQRNTMDDQIASRSQGIQILQTEKEELSRQLQDQRKSMKKSKRQLEQHFVLEQGKLVKETNTLKAEIERLKLALHTFHIVTPYRRSITANETMEVAMEVRTPTGEPILLQPDNQISVSLHNIDQDGQPTKCPLTLHAARLEIHINPTRPGAYSVGVTLGNLTKELFNLTAYPNPWNLAPRVFIKDLKQPYRATVNNRRELIVCEHRDNSVSVYDLNQPQTFKRYIGVKGKVKQPTGVATNNAGDVFITTNTHRLLKFDGKSGDLKSVGRKEAENRPVPVNQGGDGNEEFSFPRGVTVYRREVYVADQKNGRVQVFDFDLNYVQTIQPGGAKGGVGGGGGPGGGFNDPSDVAFDEQGRMYVAEYGSGKIRVFSVDGVPLETIGGEHIKKPEAIHVAGDHLYVADFSQSLVLVFQATGEFVRSVGRYGFREGEWSDLRGITSSSDGKIFVIGSEDGRIHIL